MSGLITGLMGACVVGVDGCPGGWVACRYAAVGELPGVRVFSTFAQLMDEYRDSKHIAVDIPIGLRDDGMARRCDVEARLLLVGRRSSVFPAPARCLIQEETYAQANRKSTERFGRGISQQTFHIMPKILEVDLCIRPEGQGRIFEVHPEVCFEAMAGHPMVHGKKTLDGYEERRSLLSTHFATEFPGIAAWREVWGLRGVAVGRDDVLDAATAAWTAMRVQQGKCRRFPEIPEMDGRGFRMEIVS